MGINLIVKPLLIKELVEFTNFFVTFHCGLVIVWRKEKFEIYRIGFTNKKSTLNGAFFVGDSRIVCKRTSDSEVIEQLQSKCPTSS